MNASIFQVQAQRHQQTIFFLLLSALWIGLMGYLVGTFHLGFFRQLDAGQHTGGLDLLLILGDTGLKAHFVGVPLALWAVAAWIARNFGGRFISLIAGARDPGERDRRRLCCISAA